MANIEENSETERRLLALEQAVRALRSELADIREIISSGYDVLFEGNNSRSRAIQVIAWHVDQIEDRLEPVFDKVFPRHAEFLSETQAIFDDRRKR